MTTRKPGSISLDEETWGEIERVAMGKGISKSEVCDSYITHGLAHESELTAIERYKYFDRLLNCKLDTILSVLHATFEGSIVEKFEMVFISSSVKSRSDSVTAIKNLSELSLFEVLEDIKRWDNDLYLKCSRIMGKYGKTRQRYLLLYPKKS